MKLMKRAAVHIIPSQVRHCAVKPKIIFNLAERFLSMLHSQNSAINLKRCTLYLFIVNRRLQSRTIDGDLHFFLELIERSRSGLKVSGRIWPARAFGAGRNAFWEFSDDWSLSYLGYLPVFKSARLGSEQVPLKRTLRRLEMICLELI